MKRKGLLIGLCIIMILSILMMIPKVGSFVGEKVGIPGATLGFYAEQIFTISLGAFLIFSGVAALAVPILGGAMIIIGLVLVAYSIWRWYSTTKSNG